MSDQLDSILARSRSPGRFVERKRFTLSRDKAVEKLREFSLRRPEQYILELVQSAVFAGARWIAIDSSPERLFFAWVGGKGFTSRELENVFDYLFADRAAAETRHVVQLAVALNALLQRKPKVLRIESGDGTAQGTVRMDLDRHGKGELGQPEEAFQGTYLVVEYATSWFQRFQGSDWTTEQGLVEERCMYTPVPILLNYRAPFGYRANKEIHLYGVADQESFHEEGRRGVLGMPGTTTKVDGIRLVVGGVWVSTRKIPELGMVPGRGAEPEPLVGVVCDDRLRKTADQSDIVEDARYIDMLHAVQPVATRLVRRTRHGDGYRPPALPRRVVEASAPALTGEARPAPAGPTPEPLPEQIPQVEPRPALAIEDLAALSGQAPVFWVDPDTARTLGTAGDPERFPFRLLVLTAGQALSLREAAPRLSVAAVTSAADAEFVGRVFARQAEVDEVSVPVRPADGLGGRGTLRLRLHRTGARPAWGPEEHEDVPASVRVARRAAWCGGLHLGLPGVSALLELDAGSFDPAQGPVALTHLVRQEAWRLLVPYLPEDPAARSLPETTVRALAVALIAMQASPHVYEGPAGPALALVLPRGWGAQVRAQVRRLPLARPLDPTAPPLCLDDFVGLLGPQPGAVRRLASAEELALLQPLEHRLGVGHLQPPDPDPRPVLAVALVGEGGQARWVQWSPGLVSPGPHLRAVLWLGQDLDPQLPSSRWRLVARPSPGVVLAVRADLPEHEGVVQLRDGLALLRAHLATVVREDLWPDTLPEGVDIERARQVGRLALLGLALEDPGSDERVLPRSDGGGWLRLDALRPSGDAAGEAAGQGGAGSVRARVALRHGPRVVEPVTVLLTWDEIALLASRGHPVPLRFDDPPEVWDSLVEEAATPPVPTGSGAEAGWLLRERLRIPGLDGWLGLRAPYDPTSVVLIQQSGELVALTHVDRHVPCHGLAWTLGASDSLSRVQRDLLELARLRLYQRLAERLGQGDSALGLEAERAWRDTAEPYAIDFAVHAWRARGDQAVTGTAARLLDGLRLADPEGRPLGTLRAWLAEPPDRRPLPRGHAARYRAVVAEQVDGAPRGDYAEALEYLERRLGRALALAGDEPDLRVRLHRWEGGPRGRPVRVRDEGTVAGTVSLELNEHHPVVYGGLAEAGDAREVLLLEAARMAAQVVREAGGSVDLLHVHQLLAAQRL